MQSKFDYFTEQERDARKALSRWQAHLKEVKQNDFDDPNIKRINRIIGLISDEINIWRKKKEYERARTKNT